MLRIISISLTLLALLAMPAIAGAQNAGLDAYEENAPSADGGNGEEGGEDSGTAPSDPLAAGSSAEGGGSLSEAEAGANGTPPGQLPASGLETVFLILVGLGLVGSGLVLRHTLSRGGTVFSFGSRGT